MTRNSRIFNINDLSAAHHCQAASPWWLSAWKETRVGLTRDQAKNNYDKVLKKGGWLESWPPAFSHPFPAIHFQLVFVVVWLLEGPLVDDLFLALKSTGYELSFRSSKYVTSWEHHSCSCSYWHLFILGIKTSWIVKFFGETWSVNDHVAFLIPQKFQGTL